jgi:acetylornithine deacetylase/succinyl-diaminopimelate desuccinylase-like protein
VTHNPNQALCELLAALHDKEGRVTVPGFYDRVQELAATERALLAQVPYGEAQLLADNGAPAAYGESAYTVVERIGVRPTLEINGMWGGFITEGFKTVIPSQAHAKISCRLVPDQDPAEIGRLVEAHLQRLAPPTIKVEVRGRPGSPAYVAPIDAREIQLAAAAYEQIFGVKPLYKREGGGIPIVTKFQAALGVPIVLMGFGLPDDNLHAPNEKFHLPNFYKGMQTSIVFLQGLGESTTH